MLDSDLRTAPISLLPSVPLTRGVPLVVVGSTATQYDRYAELVVRDAAAPAWSRPRRPASPRPAIWRGDRRRRPDSRLAGQAAIVTGASEGLGRIIAGGLAEAGCALVLAARRRAGWRRWPARSPPREAGLPSSRATSPTPGTPTRWSRAAWTPSAAWTGWLNAGNATLGPAEEEDMAEFADVLDVNLAARPPWPRRPPRR